MNNMKKRIFSMLPLALPVALSAADAPKPLVALSVADVPPGRKGDLTV